LAGVTALAAVCEAIRHVLESTASAENLGFEMKFKVYGPADFPDGEVKTGVSVFLYRVLPNLTHRTPAGRLGPDGRRQRTRLPVDMHIILTAWGQTSDTQNTIVGWMMRTLEDYPTIPASVLNISHPGTFAPDEGIELVISEMPGEELLRLWELLGEHLYRVSVPYVARAVFLDSRLQEPAGEPVQVRVASVGFLSEDQP
jgi:hypothetical protein